MQDDKIKDITIDRPTDACRVGSIFLGKIRNVDHSIEAAFVDIGADQVGFLPKSEYPFDQSIVEGSAIIVQIVKEPYQNKGAKLTANITIGGSNIVFLPYGDYLAFSKKLDGDTRKRMENVLKPQLRKKEGLIIRTNSAKKTDSELIHELEQLRASFQELLHSTKNKKAPIVLYRDQLIPSHMLNQYQSYPIDRIYFDELIKMKEMMTRYPHDKDKMEYLPSLPLLEGATIDQILKQLTSPVVQMKEGIVLTIEQTEGLTVIDIDSSQYRSRQNKQATLFQINQKAVPAIAAEINKRNISGIILIDFLKMKRKDEQEKIHQSLKRAFAQYPVRTEVMGFTKLGLLEMTRKRENVSLLQQLTNKSSIVAWEYNLESICYQLERELYQLNRTNAEVVLLKGNPSLLDLFQKYSSAILEKQIQLNIFIIKDSTIKGYDILRSGSNQLMDEYIVQHPDLTIDKIL